MAREKHWPAVAPVPFTIDGTVNGIMGVADARPYYVKQLVVLASNTQPAKEFQVKRIVGNLITLGLPTKDINQFSDISAYQVADNASLTVAREQPRPAIPPDQAARAAFEEEPTVAWRTLLVDEYGEPWDSDNPLPVDVIVDVGDVNFPTADTPAIQNIDIPSAGVETAVVVPANTKGFRCALRSGDATLQPGRMHLAFTVGETLTNYLTITGGCWYIPPADLGIGAAPLTFYVRTFRDNQTLELESWS